MQLENVRIEGTWTGPPDGSRVRYFECENCQFHEIRLSNRRIDSALRLEGSAIDSLDISHVGFGDLVSFSRTTFHFRVEIHETSFEKGVSFANASIYSIFSLSDHSFMRGADFRGAQFRRRGPGHEHASYGPADRPVNFDGDIIEGFADFRNAEICIPFGFTRNEVRSSLDFRDLEMFPTTPRVPSDCNPEVDLNGTVIEGPLLVEPLGSVSDTVRFNLAGTVFSDIDSDWASVRAHIGLGQLDDETRGIIISRFKSVYTASGRLKEREFMEPDVRRYNAKTVFQRLWNAFDYFITGYGYELYRIPILAGGTILFFTALFFWLGWFRSFPMGHRALLFASSSLALHSFWNVSDADCSDKYKGFAFRLGHWVSFCRIVGVISILIFSLFLATYLGR